MINIDFKSISQDIERLEKGDSYSPYSYASLLRILLSPSDYKLDDECVKVIADALRGNQNNQSYLKIINVLNELAPFEHR